MAIENEPQSSNTESTENKEKKKLRILAADDDPANRKLLYRFLEPRYEEVIIVEDGEALMRELLVGGADCILSDNNMPKKKGIQVLRDIRKMENFQTLPFILFTSDETGILKTETEVLGGVFLGKPAQRLAIYSAIETAVESKK